MELSSYTEKKEKLKADLNKMYIIAEDLQLKNQAAALKQNMKQLDDEKFNLVVVGEFSRGKSTFVNAMLGRKILPSRKKPTTAIISKIVYGEEPTYFLHYRDKNKQTQQVDEDRFFKLTAPKEKEDGSVKNKEQAFLDSIEYAAVAYPLDFCKDNVEIVDTPGTNDLNEGRVEITYRYLNQADAVIMLLSATQALSGSEVEFLKERILGNHIQDIFFVLSRRDELNEDEIPSVLHFVHKNLQKILPENIETDKHIFLLSSLQTLVYRGQKKGDTFTSRQMAKMPDSLAETGFPEFESALGHFLAEEKGRAKLSKYIAQSKSVFKNLAQDLNLRMELALHSADDIKEKAAKMEPEFKSARYNVQQITQRMHRNLQSSMDDVLNRCVLAGDDICAAAEKAVDDFDGNLSNTKELTSAVKKAVTKEQKNIINEIQSLSGKDVGDELNRAQSGLQKIWDNIAVEYQQNFNLPAVIKQDKQDGDYGLEQMWAVKNSDDDLKGKITLFGIGGGFAALAAGAAFVPVLAVLGIGAWMLGMFDDQNQVMKNKIKNKIKSHYSGVGEILSKNVKKQFSQQIEEACFSIESAANARIEDMEQQLNLIIAQKEQKEHDAAEERRMLKDKQEVLHKVERSINELKL